MGTAQKFLRRNCIFDTHSLRLPNLTPRFLWFSLVGHRSSIKGIRYFWGLFTARKSICDVIANLTRIALDPLIPRFLWFSLVGHRSLIKYIGYLWGQLKVRKTICDVIADLTQGWVYPPSAPPTRLQSRGGGGQIGNHNQVLKFQ